MMFFLKPMRFWVQTDWEIGTLINRKDKSQAKEKKSILRIQRLTVLNISAFHVADFKSTKFTSKNHLKEKPSCIYYPKQYMSVSGLLQTWMWLSLAMVCKNDINRDPLTQDWPPVGLVDIQGKRTLYLYHQKWDPAGICAGSNFIQNFPQWYRNQAAQWNLQSCG